jgi:hypothetical protein
MMVVVVAMMMIFSPDDSSAKLGGRLTFRRPPKAPFLVRPYFSSLARGRRRRRPDPTAISAILFKALSLLLI